MLPRCIKAAPAALPARGSALGRPARRARAVPVRGDLISLNMNRGAAEGSSTVLAPHCPAPGHRV